MAVPFGLNLGALGFSLPLAATEYEGKVVRVLDGDTYPPQRHRLS
jgi:hypothetical protein